MYLYKVQVGDKGCGKVASYNIKARNFDEAYQKAKIQIQRDTDAVESIEIIARWSEPDEE